MIDDKKSYIRKQRSYKMIQNIQFNAALAQLMNLEQEQS